MLYTAKVEVEDNSQPQWIILVWPRTCLKEGIATMQTSFRLSMYCYSTALSKFIWKIKNEQNTHPMIRWGIVRKSKSYAVEKFYKLCQEEKLASLMFLNPCLLFLAVKRGQKWQDLCMQKFIFNRWYGTWMTCLGQNRKKPYKFSIFKI